MAAAAAEALNFWCMSKAQLWQWVEANPGRVNDRDMDGYTPLTAAVSYKKGLSLIMWLLDEKGVDVNATTMYGSSALHYANSLDILTALLDRGVDPTRPNKWGNLPLMHQAPYGSVEVVACLLQDPRVRATINMQDKLGSTALHHASYRADGAPNVHLLLQADADPTIPDNNGLTPLDVARSHHATYHAIIALLEEALAEAEKASILVKARRLALAANSNVVTPSCLKARVARGQPLPRVVLIPLTDGQTDEENEDEGEEGRKLCTTLAFMCGVGRDGMPRDVFRVVMDLLMPSWDPLRRKNAGTGQTLAQG